MIKEIGNVLRRFVTITGYSMLVLVVTGPVLHMIDCVNNTQIGLIAVCSFITALSSLMFISSKELHGLSWWIRELLCILINMAVILPITHYAGLWQTTIGMIVVMAIIIAIAFGNHLIEFFFDLRMANQLNRKLKEMR